RPATQSHEYVRAGTAKILTLFHPATGRVSLRPAASGTNTVLHGWLKEVLGQIVAALPARAAPLDPAANRALWQAWQDGLAVRFGLPADLPPPRILLVWDNLAGHETPEMVLWLCRHGIMPLHTPLGGSWLNMAESIQRILKQRALAGQHRRVANRLAIGCKPSPRTGTSIPRRLSGVARDGSDESGSATGAARL